MNGFPLNPSVCNSSQTYLTYPFSISIMLPGLQIRFGTGWDRHSQRLLERNPECHGWHAPYIPILRLPWCWKWYRLGLIHRQWVLKSDHVSGNHFSGGEDGQKWGIRVIVEWTSKSNLVRWIATLPSLNSDPPARPLQFISRLHPCCTGSIPRLPQVTRRLKSERFLHRTTLAWDPSVSVRMNFQGGIVVTGGIGWVSLSIMNHQWLSTNII